MRKSSFLKHHRKIKIEGTDLPAMLNKCIGEDLKLKDLRWKNPIEISARVTADDHERLKKVAGHSYRITVAYEGGAVPFLKKLKHNKISIIGALLMGALIFYQSLFVAEIRVDGYRSITEADIRNTLSQAGLYEGARKPESYSDIEAAIYKNHDEITWVSIFEDGRLVKVSVAEASDATEAVPEDKRPAGIIAGKSGIIVKVLPLKGNSLVEKGDYVNKGDMLISGRFGTIRSHAEGTALAKVPYKLEFYMEKTRCEFESTGRRKLGVEFLIGDVKIDTSSRHRYEKSLKREKKLIDITEPMPLKLSFSIIEEVDCKEKDMDLKKARKVAEAAVRQYASENFKDGQEIVDTSIELTYTKSLIKACVFLEVIEDIGVVKVY